MYAEMVIGDLASKVDLAELQEMASDRGLVTTGTAEELAEAVYNYNPCYWSDYFTNHN